MMATWLPPSSVTAASRRPSLLKSPTAMMFDPKELTGNVRGPDSVGAVHGPNRTTMARSVAVLFAGFGSGWSAETTAMLVIGSARVGVATIVTVITLPLANGPANAQLTRPADGGAHVPRVADADTKVTLDGSVSTTVTPVAGD